MAIRIDSIPIIPRIGSAPGPKPAEQTAANDFGQFLAEALGKVEQAQQEAAVAAERLATGEIKDIAEVTIASEKATLALQLTVQVRNKVLEAYQEIMRMPV
jgi:flagellar hook-basal body complex protein FliE